MAQQPSRLRLLIDQALLGEPHRCRLNLGERKREQPDRDLVRRVASRHDLPDLGGQLDGAGQVGPFVRQ